MSNPRRPDRGRGGPRGGGRGGSSSGRGSPATFPPGSDAESRSTGGGGRGRGGPGYGPPQGQGRGGGRGFDRGGGGRGFDTRGGGPPGRGFDPRGRGRGRGGTPGAIFGGGGDPPIDARLADIDQQIAAFKQAPYQVEMPFRPGFGTLGRAIKLRANFFAMKLPKGTVYDYSVSITPKAGTRSKRIFHLLEQHPQYAQYVGSVAHDSSARLVSARELPEPLVILVDWVEDGDNGPRPNAQRFTVEVKLTGKFDPADMTRFLQGRPDNRAYDTLPLISALNIVLQQHASTHGYRVGRNRYFFKDETPGNVMPLGLGIEAWQGFFMSIRPTYKQLAVNVNVCMTAFYSEGNLGQRMSEFNGQTGGMPQSFANRLKVFSVHLGYKRTYTIFRIANSTARRERFDCEEFNGMITVEDFFKRKYKINLQHAHDLPLIDVGRKGKAIYLPAEICSIAPGQAYRGRLDDRATASMIQYACNDPATNANAIVNEGFPLLGLQPGATGGPLAGFGIEVSNQMAVVPARILPAPGLSYRVGRPNVKDGSWNILNVQFQRGADMSRWAVMLVQEGRTRTRRGDPLEFDGANDPALRDFLRAFSDKCKTSGMAVPNGPPTILVTPQLNRSTDGGRAAALNQIKATLTNGLDRNKKPHFVLVLLSGIDKFIYPGIKQLCDSVLGIHTVHMLLEKARGDPRKQDQYFSNVALKVNSKLGGINHQLDTQAMQWLTQKKTMIVGIDVTHPGPMTVKGTPSLAAVVASVDDSFVQFPASLRLQKADWSKESKEMVEALSDMMVERLQLYQRKNKTFPERIFVYRDGVSEGQFDMVIKEEIPKIFDACKRVGGGGGTAYKPKVTVVICGKRHHARFPATNQSDIDRKGNTLPGTIVDKGVTDIYAFSFYLQAHAGLQGTVRPTLYTVVYDENRLSADQIQQGTNTNSYLYARATKAVSLVPAAYYADLACERGRCYLNMLMNSTDAQSTTGGGALSSADLEREKERVYKQALQMWGNGVHADLRDSMFYI